MGNGEQSGSGGRDSVRVLLATMIGSTVGASLGMLLVNLIDFHGWGVVVFVTANLVGLHLGRHAGFRLFGRPACK